MRDCDDDDDNRKVMRMMVIVVLVMVRTNEGVIDFLDGVWYLDDGDIFYENVGGDDGDMGCDGGDDGDMGRDEREGVSDFLEAGHLVALLLMLPLLAAFGSCAFANRCSHIYHGGAYYSASCYKLRAYILVQV